MPFKLHFDVNSVAKPRAVRVYSAVHCDSVISYMKQGHTVTAYCGVAGISRKLFDEWALEHPELAEAIERGRAAAVLYWEKEQASALRDGRSAVVATFALKNLAPTEWREKVEINTHLHITTSQAELVDAIDRKFNKLIEHDPVESGDPRKTRH
ncbi:hypothetical protein [Mesorhizobium sp. B4-1-4]|uniref:hypothetical protein n=1 Tax=Mesorhizobium sp. B4-1-4 TaxID=2589888 RepID=UPI00112862E4|nr:hypothetical protein [Mesorhizobium sp. B4-1-4]UCI32548.1 hypothetical protein FJW03_03575 [Mesorhizobium sp. B4-1-4]